MTKQDRINAEQAAAEYYDGTRALPALQWMEDALEALPWLEENLGEHEAQYRNEVAMFGDAGVGQALRIRDMQDRLCSIRNRLTKLLGSTHQLF